MGIQKPKVILIFGQLNFLSSYQKQILKQNYIEFGTRILPN